MGLYGKRSKRYVCASEQWKAFKWSQILTGLLNIDVSTELYKIMEHPFWAKTGITKGDIKSDNMRKVACQILMLISGYEYTAFDQKKY